MNVHTSAVIRKRIFQPDFCWCTNAVTFFRQRKLQQQRLVVMASQRPLDGRLPALIRLGRHPDFCVILDCPAAILFAIADVLRIEALIIRYAEYFVAEQRQWMRFISPDSAAAPVEQPVERAGLRVTAQVEGIADEVVRWL